jgi:hypothetical protein
MLKYLRIAVTALSLTTCVLLIALWVRTLFAIDTIQGPVGNIHVVATSRHSGLSIGLVRLNRMPHSWSHKSEPANEKVSVQYSSVIGFGIHSSNRLSAIRLPVWCILLLSAAAATVPWLPWRFSLRTMLIAMTVVAALLGLVIWTTK